MSLDELRADVREVMAGSLLPEDLAQRVVPAPRKLRSSRPWLVLIAVDGLLLAAASVIGIIAIGSAISGVRFQTTLDFIVLSIFCAVAGELSRRIAVERRLQRIVVTREIDQHYRKTYCAELVTQLREIAAECEVADSAFLQAAVTEIQQALSNVGVPNVQVSILSMQGSGAYISYYAGDEQPIAQGSVIRDFSAVGSRRVICRLPCPLGFDSDNHQLVVVATCSKLGESERALVKDAAAILSAACAHPSQVA